MEPSQHLSFSRRWILGCGLLVACGAAVYKLTGMSLAFLKPPRKNDTFGSLVNAGALSGLPESGAPPRLVAQGRFWLVHSESGLCAVYNSCTHLQCLFGWDEEKKLFICPCHGSEFSREGKVLKGPASRDLDRFPLFLVDGRGNIIRHSPGQPYLTVADMLKVEEGNGQVAPGQAPATILSVQVDTGRRLVGEERKS
jgi:nitrite reductase/ring-hydroxylating ferredoxin subunit